MSSHSLLPPLRLTGIIAMFGVEWLKKKTKKKITQHYRYTWINYFANLHVDINSLSFCNRHQFSNHWICWLFFFFFSIILWFMPYLNRIQCLSGTFDRRISLEWPQYLLRSFWVAKAKFVLGITPERQRHRRWPKNTPKCETRPQNGFGVYT